MLELSKLYKNTFYVYLSVDKRYEYSVVVVSEPKKKTRFVYVTIYDHQYQYDDYKHQYQSCTFYNCYNYRVDSMLNHCQYLFDAGGLIRNGNSFSDIKCHAKEK